jgi:hypothetical protein
MAIRIVLENETLSTELATLERTDFNNRRKKGEAFELHP